MSLLPTTEHAEAARRERELAHQRLDQWLDAHASGVALMQRDINKGLAQ